MTSTTKSLLRLAVAALLAAVGLIALFYPGAKRDD